MLSNKVAIITGATKGIGKAISQLFCQSNAVVYGIGRNQDNLNELSELYHNFHPINADICDTSQTKNIFTSIYKEQGHIDILINNAGIMSDSLIGMISDEQIFNMFQTNVFSVIQFTQMASRFMKKQKSGSIINIASIIGVHGNAGQSVYSATKGAVISFTKSAAKELSSYGIRVNAIAPGIINTDLISNVPEDKLAKRISQIQLGRIGQPIDVANTALFLATDMSGYITGQIINVDGLAIL
ncbi:MAG: SDR family oxidoreductase [Lachnospiraceae bacterium]|nr:SDR family oxidoreductase [Lachnospiraceae bacterium]